MFEILLKCGIFLFENCRVWDGRLTECDDFVVIE